jgi:hypothetical protein
VHDYYSDATCKSELDDVEHKLDQWEPTVEQEDGSAPENTSEDEVVGAAEQETEHQRNVRERE